jgi:DNA-binding beta-propeller fold protein YncE
VNRSLALSALALAALALSAGPVPARAQLVFDRAIYQDDKEGALKFPEGVACNDAGAVVVADSGNGRLVLFTYRDGVLTGGTPVKPAQLAYPTRVQLDSKGNIWVLDRKTRKILKLDAKGTFLAALEAKPGSAITASLPVSFKLDAQDQAYVVDVVAGRVVVLDPDGKVLRQIELPRGKAVFTDVHVDPGGSIYALDGVGASLWVADKGATSFRPLTQSLEDKMNFPVYLTGRGGKLYVVDQFGNGVVTLGVDGSYQGRQLAIGWSEGLVYYPAQLCVNGKGEAVLADRSNNRVQLFTAPK